MKVEQKDLIGDLKDFPIEIVQRMVDYQVQQGNPADIELFQNTTLVGKKLGSFNWDDTEEGADYWYSILVNKEFDTPNPTTLVAIGDGIRPDIQATIPKYITVQWTITPGPNPQYAEEMRVISSNHERFIVGYRFDYGFMGVASRENYIITVLPKA